MGTSQFSLYTCKQLLKESYPYLSSAWERYRYVFLNQCFLQVLMILAKFVGDAGYISPYSHLDKKIATKIKNTITDLVIYFIRAANLRPQINIQTKHFLSTVTSNH